MALLFVRDFGMLAQMNDKELALNKDSRQSKHFLSFLNEEINELRLGDLLIPA